MKSFEPLRVFWGCSSSFGTLSSRLPETQKKGTVNSTAKAMVIATEAPRLSRAIESDLGL